MINNKTKKIVIANFKMNLVMKYELEHWLSNFKKAVKGLSSEKVTLVLCPPSIYLERFIKIIKNKGVEFGLQNCFWEKKGSFTGEISPEMIKTVGGGYVILGHSERRRFLGETNEIVAKKILTSLKSGIRPVICIGETLEQRKRDQTFQIISKQIKEGLSFVAETKVDKLIICYEPVWAISTNNPDFLPSSNNIMEARLLIRKILVSMYGRKRADLIPILYGGSVDSKNVKEVCLEAGMDGVLVGKASLLPYDLVKIATVIGNQF